jgi:hypothetical protein
MCRMGHSKGPRVCMKYFLDLKISMKSGKHAINDAILGLDK